MHGKTSIARLDRSGVLFKEMDAEIKVARYHSLEADPDTLPAELFVTAMADGEIMAVEHKSIRFMDCNFIQNQSSHQKELIFYET